jgi:hypothetical protein
MKQQIKQIEDEMSDNIEKTTEEPIEYFMPEQIGLKFCWMEAQQENFAEDLVKEVKEDEYRR